MANIIHEPTGKKFEIDFHAAITNPNPNISNTNELDEAARSRQINNPHLKKCRVKYQNSYRPTTIKPSSNKNPKQNS